MSWAMVHFYLIPKHDSIFFICFGILIMEVCYWVQNLELKQMDVMLWIVIGVYVQYHIVIVHERPHQGRVLGHSVLRNLVKKGVM